MTGDPLHSTYGTLSEQSLHEVWDEHEFCYPVLESMISHIDGIDTVLDLGCGSGEMLSRLTRLDSPLTLMGIDSSEVALEAASQKLGSAASLIRGDLSDVFAVEGGGVLIYSSGFTSNLFCERRWDQIVAEWLRVNPSALAFIYDVFWWDPLSSEVCQSDVFEGEESSLSWNVKRSTDQQISYLYDTKNEAVTTVTSFNHQGRSLSVEGGPNWRAHEVLYRKVETGEGLLTKSCTRVVARSYS